MTQHPNIPPTPQEVRILQETVETLNRTIRVLISNYNELLAKFEAEHEPHTLVVIWAPGTAQSFAAGMIIPQGLWWEAATGEVMYSDGTTTAATATSMAALTATVEKQVTPPAP